LDTAWILYWTGVGVTAAGWATIGVGDDGLFSAGVMTAANVALIGAGAIAADRLAAGDQRRPRTVVIPIATGTF
ncbi:MAG: hypothetical protein ABMB14_31655, partial [Myxococcota bacterium]